MAAIELLIEPRRRTVGNGTVDRLLPYRERRMVGPYIFADHMGPRRLPAGSTVDIDAHPHIGLSTLTYLFAGRIVHRDSTGAVATITPGAVNWMTAGVGVCHTERTDPTEIRDVRLHHGLQLWVALPDEDEDRVPFFEHHPAPTQPTQSRPGVEVTVAAGSGWGLVAPVSVSSPLILAEVRLDGGGTDLDPTHPERAVIAVDGAPTLDDRPLPPGRLAVVSAGARARLGGTGRVMVLGGEPVGRRHIWWNFVHSERDRIEQAKADWTAQRFPLVPGDHEPWVPLP